jgi:glycerophosphoryl diester phosphodiesterase
MSSSGQARPIYVIAHRTNALRSLEEAIAAGANAVECDVRHDVIDHDGAFPWSTSLTEWLETASDLASRYEHFGLIYFDVKEPRSLPALVANARSKLPSTLSCVFSIADFEDRACFDSIIGNLGEREGIVIDAMPDVTTYAKWLESHVKEIPSWYSYGVPSRKERHSLESVMPSIRSALLYRNQRQSFAKVCVWTLTEQTLMQTYLNTGVEALVVERPAVPDMLALVSTAPDVRLATRADDAFAASTPIEHDPVER